MRLYRAGICLALSGPCIWYGRMQPYLNDVELHEHYYIQGPSGCQGEAMQMCAMMGRVFYNYSYCRTIINLAYVTTSNFH